MEGKKIKIDTIKDAEKITAGFLSSIESLNSITDEPNNDEQSSVFSPIESHTKLDLGLGGGIDS